MSKKKQKAANDTPETGVFQKFKKTWEYKSLRFVVRIALYIFLIVYLSHTLPQSWRWAQIRWVQSQSIERLQTLAPKYLDANRPDKLHEWVTMRKHEDIDTIMEVLEPYTAKLSPMTFLIYAARLSGRGEISEAVFWYHYGLFRLRFDAIRCGDVEGVSVIQGITYLMRNEKILAATQQMPELVPQNIRAALDMDEKYPAHNHPLLICKTVQDITRRPSTLMPEEKWAYARHLLRNDSERGLAILEEKMQESKTQENTKTPTPENETPPETP